MHCFIQLNKYQQIQSAPMQCSAVCWVFSLVSLIKLHLYTAVFWLEGLKPATKAYVISALILQGKVGYIHKAYQTSEAAAQVTCPQLTCKESKSSKAKTILYMTRFYFQLFLNSAPEPLVPHLQSSTLGPEYMFMSFYAETAHLCCTVAKGVIMEVSDKSISVMCQKEGHTWNVSITVKKISKICHKYLVNVNSNVQ